MGKSNPGDPGQAGTYDPKKGGKFEPTTKAQPAPEATPGRYSGKERRDDAERRRREGN